VKSVVTQLAQLTERPDELIIAPAARRPLAVISSVTSKPNLLQ
jgi:hypothetical protein